MAELKEGDKVWTTHDVFLVDWNGGVMVTDSGRFGEDAWTPCGPIVPDVPGLDLERFMDIIAGMGVKETKMSLMFGNSALAMIAERARFKRGDEQSDNYEQMVSQAAALLLRLAAALEVK